MAELKGNSLWGDIESGAGNVADRVTGPAGDYLSGIRTPASLGVGQNGDLGQLITNAGAVGTYVDQLVQGPKLGNATFVETGGMCKAPNGAVIPRWSYVNNRASGTDVLPRNVASAIGEGTLDGIIPGMFGDLAALNPLTLLNGLIEPGVPQCYAFRCPVTDAAGLTESQETRFVTPSLEATDIRRACTLVEGEEAKNLESEGYANQFSPARPARMVKTPESMVPQYLGLGAALVGMLLLKYTFGRR